MSASKRRAIRQLNKDNWEDEVSDPETDQETTEGKDEICNRKKLVAKRRSIGKSPSNSLIGTVNFLSDPSLCTNPKMSNFLCSSSSSSNTILAPPDHHKYDCDKVQDNFQNSDSVKMTEAQMEYYLTYMIKLNKKYINEMVDAIVEVPYIDLSTAFPKYFAYIEEMRSNLAATVDYDLESPEDTTLVPTESTGSFQCENLSNQNMAIPDPQPSINFGVYDYSNHQGKLHMPKPHMESQPLISRTSNKCLSEEKSFNSKTSPPRPIIFPFEVKCVPSAPIYESFGPGYFSTAPSTTCVTNFAPLTSVKLSVPLVFNQDKISNSQSLSLSNKDIITHESTNAFKINPLTFGKILPNTTNHNSIQVADFSKNQDDNQTTTTSIQDTNEGSHGDEQEVPGDETRQNENGDGGYRDEGPVEFILPPPRDDVPQFEEENCVWVKRSKLYRKDTNRYVDIGVGFCYLKEMTENNPNKEKIQLLLRAANTSGIILLNTVIYKKKTPVKRLGKNTVLVVVPTNHLYASTYLIRVKLENDAKELFRLLTGK